MLIQFGHTNIVTQDWRRLAKFYVEVFGCAPVPPERDLHGDWLEKGTGVRNTHLKGVHLQLPGYGQDGPTLEIFEYVSVMETERSIANRKGFGHIAFRVDDVGGMAAKVVRHGGSMVGELVDHQIEGVGLLTFVYVADPDGNIIELQKWT
ncbi:MAG: VOC family protein [Ignavibacteriales bacterium]|nr:VOC family protein [Ignavibacteriales bacterium]